MKTCFSQSDIPIYIVAFSNLLLSSFPFYTDRRTEIHKSLLSFLEHFLFYFFPSSSLSCLWISFFWVVAVVAFLQTVVLIPLGIVAVCINSTWSNHSNELSFFLPIYITPWHFFKFSLCCLNDINCLFPSELKLHFHTPDVAERWEQILDMSSTYQNKKNVSLNMRPETFNLWVTAERVHLRTISAQNVLREIRCTPRHVSSLTVASLQRCWCSCWYSDRHPQRDVGSVYSLSTGAAYTRVFMCPHR
jgi:hypothetical protein